VFWAGVLFLLVSATPLRETIAMAIPPGLRLAAAAGIGLLLTLIGLRNAGLVEADPATLLRLGTLDHRAAFLLVGVLIAVPSGIVAAMRKDSAWDYGAMGFAIFVYSMPAFWKGIILIWIFSVHLRWFPAMGYVAPWSDLADGLWKLVLPAITLGTFFSGLVARIIRSSLLEVLEADYIKAARAKGVRQAALVYRHALSNALIPVVTVIGLQFGALLGGAVLTETVFAIPGMGRLTVNAILNRDYSVVQGTILAGVFLVVLVNLAVDLTYAFLNPRIRVA
jgi:peptide/nickel transport system permease protein